MGWNVIMVYMNYKLMYTVVKQWLSIFISVIIVLSLYLTSKAGFTLRRLDRRLDKRSARPVKVAKRLQKLIFAGERRRTFCSLKIFNMQKLCRRLEINVGVSCAPFVNVPESWLKLYWVRLSRTLLANVDWDAGGGEINLTERLSNRGQRRLTVTRRKERDGNARG